MNGFPILTALILTPAAGAVLALCMPNRRPDVVRALGYAFTVAAAGLSFALLWQFNPHSGAFQFTESASWIPALGIRWQLGVDGLSLFMVVLTGLLFPIGLLASHKIESPKAFIVWMLILESAVMGVFLGLDLIVFFLFFEIVLVPMYFIIGKWGHGRRVYAALKFFVFTMAGSAFLFVGILAVAFLHQSATGTLTFDYVALAKWAPNGLATATAAWLFFAFGVAFAVKVPLFPLHTWLPDAHTEAPTAGSVILAGVLLKMGTYGFLRFSLGLFPGASARFAWVFLVLATIGIIYGAVVATMQPDLKRLIAYSSIAHLGFVVLGIFAITVIGIEGGVFTMVSHGLTTGALFLLVGMLYDRRHTRLISAFRGIWKATPLLGGLFLIAVFASIGLPGFSGFVGEFLALLGTFLVHRPYAIVSSVGVILAALYLLWAFQRSFTGVPDEATAAMPEINWRELACVVPLLALSFFLGVYPKPMLSRIEPSAACVVAHVEANSDYVQPERAGAETPDDCPLSKGTR
ncbi:MAG: complex I subunit 4 family protein [Acidimicrobiia bacterium]